jgi:hypothetical protein
MAGAKVLADGNTSFFVLPDAPADPDAITAAEATAAGVKNWSDKILFSDFDLGPSGSDKIDEKSLASKGNAQANGLTSYTGGYTVFRYFDPATKLPDPTEDEPYQMSKEKNTTLHIVVRENAKDATAPLAVGDEYNYYEVLTDDPTRGDRTGNIKARISVAVQNGAIAKQIVA